MENMLISMHKKLATKTKHGFSFLPLFFLKASNLVSTQTNSTKAWLLPRVNENLYSWEKMLHIYRAEFVEEICVTEQTETANMYK